MNEENKPPTAAPLHGIVMRLRDYAECHDGDVDEAADIIERLLKFIRDRVADRATMMKGGYHARRICLEAEKLLRDESA
jgi:hypothetical protein